MAELMELTPDWLDELERKTAGDFASAVVGPAPMRALIAAARRESELRRVALGIAHALEHHACGDRHRGEAARLRKAAGEKERDETP